MLTSLAGFNSVRPDELRAQVLAARPFPFLKIDNFLDEEFALAVADAFPRFDVALTMGRTFSTVNEQKKVQISDSELFPQPIRELHALLASPAWLDTLGYITDVPSLMADPELVGGGIHETGPHGLLDVHVDFNFVSDRQLYRRLNILVYFNPDWQDEWGGRLELWDRDVVRCEHSFAPVFNRCIIFATSDISFHGVTAVTCPPGVTRKSFAGYYYTQLPPLGWAGHEQGTLFKARPNELFKGRVLMPGERIAQRLRTTLHDLKHVLDKKHA